ncbi:MAG TPA: copper resistance protein CopC, partial [Candidatus Sulfotelmatobacter sp.]|nr:copper resistance protein CopC [Candidatus Sulfotelmatobacter sp.]
MPHLPIGRALARRVARACALAGALAVASLLVAGPALAHAVFVSATPAPGDLLRTAPSSVRIVFSEPLNPGLSGITILDSAGTAVSAPGGGVDPADGRAYEVRLPALTPDRYTVAWHTVSLVDGHTRTGSYPFTVLEPDGSLPALAAGAAPPPSQPPTIPDALLALAAWMTFGGLALVAGPALLALAGRRPAVMPEPLVRAFRLVLAGGAGLALAGSTLSLVWALLPAGGVTALGSLLGSTFGVWWMVRTVALVALLGLAATSAAAVLHGRPRWTLALVALLLVAVTATAAVSHGAAADEPAWGFAFDLAHLLGVAVWIGAVIALALAFRTLDGDDAPQAAYRLELLRRVSLAAGMAVPLVLLSGLGSALIELAGPSDLFDTDYGRALGLKLLIGAALLLVAGLNALWFRPAAVQARPAGRRLRTTVAVEAVLGVAVIGVAALVSIRVPARAADATQAVVQQVAADEDPASSYSGSTTVQDVPAAVTITPALLGRNVVRVETDQDLGASLVVIARDPAGHGSTQSLQRTGTALQADGSVHTVYGGTVTLDGPAGSWQVLLAAPGTSASGAPLLLPLAAGSASAPSPASNGPSASWLALLALAAAGAVGVAGSRAFGS